MKKIITLILSVLLIIEMLPISAFALESVDFTNIMSKWDGSIASGFAKGSGTEIDPYIISTGSELAYLAKEVNNGRNFEGEYIFLANDIDLQNKPWTPIGKVTSYDIYASVDLTKDRCVAFSGTFEGNCHTIYNVSFGNNYPYFYMGLFAVSFGTIQNLYVENLDVVYPKSNYNPTSFTEHHYYAGIVTFQIGGTIYNCHYSGNVDSCFSACSGIVYSAKDSIVKNCTSSGSITYDGAEPEYYAYCSGIVTICSSSKLENCINYMKLNLVNYVKGGGISYQAKGDPEYYNCVNYGDITSDKRDISGIVVIAGGIKLNNCKNYGNIMIYSEKNTTAGAGGIIVSMSSGEILNCSNYGDIHAVGSDAAGILTCPHSSDTIINIENCFNKGNITTEKYFAGGIVAWGWLDNTTIKNCYNTGTITGINPEYSYSTCGGISGANSGSGAKILFCYNTGTISSKARTAAICYGSSGYEYDVDFCYYLDNITIGVKNNLNSTATVRKLTSFEMKLQQNYEGFDFKNTWAISPDKNGGYPCLKNNPEVNLTDTSFINFSKTKNELEYPIFSEESFAKQLKVWINESDYFQSFEKYLSNYTYEELLYKTIDIPVMDSSSGTAFNINGQAQIKDLMAYIIFSDRAQKYINNVMINVNAKISSNDINGAFEYFLEKLKIFNAQYYYFQNKLNGGDAFNEGLQALLLAKTAMAIVDELKVTFKNGETEYIILNKQGKTIDEFIEEHKEDITAVIPLKSYSYLTDIYKANLAESSELYYYDDLKYYILSGGDTSYLNPTYSSSLKGYSLFVKNSKFVIKALKESGESIDADSLITLGLDNLSYFSDHFDSKTAEIIKAAKEGYEYFGTATDLVKAISSASLLGVVSGAWSLSNAYIDEVKEVYQNAESTEAGWYAFTYYYLSKENPDLLNAMINLDTGSASWNFDGMISYGFPCDYNDKLQNAIVSYYSKKQSYLEHTYTPDEDFRMYLLNAANTLNTITNMDCETYKNDLIEYLLAKLNSEVDSRGIKFRVETTSNIANGGTISGNGVYLADNNVTIAAEANDGYKFIGWIDLSTGETISTQNIYSFKVTKDHHYLAQFISYNEESFCLPTIVSQSQSASYYLGQEIQSLCINASIDNLDDLSINWYQTPYSSKDGGTLVYEGNSFVPNITEIGNYYYYAIIKNVKKPSAKVYSKPICLTIKKPLVIDLQISKEPTQKVYLTNETFNKTGMSVNLLYSDGSVQNISNYIANYDFSTEGKKVVTIGYLGFIQNVTVEVVTVLNGAFSSGVGWRLDSIEKVLRVYGDTNIPNFACLEVNGYSKYIKDIIIDEGVTTINNYAFYGLKDYERITIPFSVTSIANNAFINNSDFTIYCYYSSFAKKFAAENNINISLIRVDYDASGDGIVSSQDLVTVKRYLLNDCDISPDGDCNKDETINICDLVALKEFIALSK
ncbi:MAG: leucine-rich repeat protein [Clostridia bacterium]|nr:leucine-rich repeat protein [Clostridia bacterium]